MQSWGDRVGNTVGTMSRIHHVIVAFNVHDYSCNLPLQHTAISELQQRHYVIMLGYYMKSSQLSLGVFGLRKGW